jgi:ATP-dependent RNA circularization protein (DNA/RNA ligase family)
MKPLDGPAYGSIGHLPGSKLGPKDRTIPAGQAVICCERTRDKHDTVIVTEKLDGSCCAVLRRDNKLHALTRSGYYANTSPFAQHKLFDKWVEDNCDRFMAVLQENERLVGEWLAQAHGTKYNLCDHEPFGVFDLIRNKERALYSEFDSRIGTLFSRPSVIHVGGAISAEAAMALHRNKCWPSEGIEGIVYRVERFGKVDFLCKYVRSDYVPGKYLPEISGHPEVWQWQPK